MKTGVDIVDVIIERISVPSVTDVLGSSSIFPDTSPDNFTADRIVVNSLPVSGGQLQTAVININVCVKNLKLKIAGQPDNSQPDRKRLNEIAKPILEILEDAIISGIVTEIDNIAIYPDKEVKEHFLNIRVRIYSANLK
ncbi:MAG: hypothetical protein J7527_15740 [Chitinophagaceae bacterium]|nr:hypothetical protein [Chitinophagaceae bacterium]